MAQKSDILYGWPLMLILTTLAMKMLPMSAELRTRLLPPSEIFIDKSRYLLDSFGSYNTCILILTTSAKKMLPMPDKIHTRLVLPSEIFINKSKYLLDSFGSYDTLY